MASTLTEVVARACKETAPEELRDQVHHPPPRSADRSALIGIGVGTLP